MSIGLPNIEITFQQLASTAIKRSENGIACVVLHDAVEAVTLHEYNTISDVVLTGFSADNQQIIKDAFLGTPAKLYVVVVPTAGTFADAKATLDSIKFNYLCYISDSSQDAVATYVKEYNNATDTRRIKAVVYASAADDQHVINFTNTSVKRKGANTAVDGYTYLARIAGLLAGLPFSRTSTYYNLTDLESATEPADVNTAIGGGQFVIINDYGEVKVARGVNSLTTLPAGVTSEDFKKIAIVEASDMLLEDVATAFKNDYLGKMKNSTDNQMLLISSINTYLDTLTKEEVLDPEFNNTISINVEAQRAAWVEAGHVEAENWDDEKVIKSPYSSNVYLKGNVKFLDGMEDLYIEFNC